MGARARAFLCVFFERLGSFLYIACGNKDPQTGSREVASLGFSTRRPAGSSLEENDQGLVARRERRYDVAMASGKFVLLIGPSGVGKSVILKKLRVDHSDWHFPRSATTRERRKGEGDDLYRFVSEEKFDQLIEEDAVLEWAAVHSGARYGTLAEEIVPYLQEGKIVVREVDVQGFDSIRTHQLFRGESALYKLQSIFILPENKEQLIGHITKRAPMNQAELNHRMASMEKELTYANLCDHTVMNAEGKLKEAITEVERIIG